LWHEGYDRGRNDPQTGEDHRRRHFAIASGRL
jgi:hypothetical protein